MSLLFNTISRFVSFSSKKQASFNFWLIKPMLMAVVIICSDFGAQEDKVCYCFHCFPTCLLWSDGTGYNYVELLYNHHSFENNLESFHLQTSLLSSLNKYFLSIHFVSVTWGTYSAFVNCSTDTYIWMSSYLTCSKGKSWKNPVSVKIRLDCRKKFLNKMHIYISFTKMISGNK